jgi:hypothetical protein
MLICDCWCCCWCGAAQGAHRLLLKTTNIKMGVRLGLLNQDHSKALIFEVDSAKMKGEAQPWRGGGRDVHEIRNFGSPGALIAAKHLLRWTAQSMWILISYTEHVSHHISLLCLLLLLFVLPDTDYLTTPTRDSMADITITEISLENTLLLDAINKGKARFVSDCASYLQVRRSAWRAPVYPVCMTCGRCFGCYASYLQVRRST